MPATIADDYLIAADGADLAVRDYGGRGPELVCLHGGSTNAAIWDELARSLGGDVRMVAFDERGHGRSSSTSDWSANARLSDIHCVIRAVGLERPVILGHGTGADLALLYGATNLHCAGVIAVEAPAVAVDDLAPSADPTNWEDATEAWRRYGTYGWRGTVPELEERLLRQRAGKVADGATEAEIDALLAVARRHHVRQTDGSLLRRPTVEDLVAMGRVREVEPWVSRRTIDLVACPLLFVYADRHRFVAHEGSIDAAVRNRPERRVAWVEGGHLVPLESPEALARLVAGHLVTATGGGQGRWGSTSSASRPTMSRSAMSKVWK